MQNLYIPYLAQECSPIFSLMLYQAQMYKNGWKQKGKGLGGLGAGIKNYLYVEAKLLFCR